MASMNFFKNKQAKKEQEKYKNTENTKITNFLKARRTKLASAVNLDPVAEEKLNKKSMKALNEYIKYLQHNNCTTQTIYSYKKDLIQWFKFIYHFQNNKPIVNVGVPVGDFIDEEDLKLFLLYCMEHNNNKNRMHRRMTSISGIYMFMSINGTYIGEIPSEEGKSYLSILYNPPKTEEAHDLTWEQVSKIIKFVEKHPNQQYELLVKLAFSSLTNIEKLATLTFDDLELQDNCFIQETGTTRRDRVVTKVLFGTEVKQMLADWLKLRKQNNIYINRLFIHQCRFDCWSPANKFAISKWIAELGLKSIKIPLTPIDMIEAGKIYLRHHGMNESYINILANYQTKEKDINFYRKIANSTITIESMLRKCIG